MGAKRLVDYIFRVGRDDVSPAFGRMANLERTFMSTTNRTFNNFNRKSAQAGRSAQKFGRVVNRSFRKIGTGMTSISQGLMNKWTMLFGGAGLGMLGKSQIEFDEKMVRIGIKADMSRKQVKKLTDEMINLAQPTYQTKETLAEGIDSILERTGDFKLADAVKKDLGIISTATDATTKDIGYTVADMNQKLGISAGNMRPAFDILATQGKMGAFELRDMASLFPRILASASQLNVKGIGGLRKIGALLQIFRRGTGSPQMAATAFERSISNVIQKRDTIVDELGFDIVKGYDESGREIYHEIDVIFTEIIKRSQGRATILNKIFGEYAIRGLNALAISFKKFGDKEFRSFVNVAGDSTVILNDFKQYAESAAAKIKGFKAQLDKFANSNLATPIEKLTSALDYLNKHPAFANKSLSTLLGLGGGALIGKVLGLGGPVGAVGVGAYMAADNVMKNTSGGNLLGLQVQKLYAMIDHAWGGTTDQQYEIIQEQLENDIFGIYKKRNKAGIKERSDPMFDKASNLSKVVSNYFNEDKSPVFGRQEKNNITVNKPPVINFNPKINTKIMLDPVTGKEKTEVSISTSDIVARAPITE